MLPPPHLSAIIVSSGDELLTGQLLDTNAQYLAGALTGRGILPAAFMTVPDDLGAIVEALGRACARAPLVIMSGGLGPTEGDLTRQALAQLTGDELVLDGAAEAHIADLLARRGRPMSERQRRQAMRPRRAGLLANQVGTAPGLHIVVDNTQHTAHNTQRTDLFALPGPPGELRPMFESLVVPLLRPDPAHAVSTRVLHVLGIPEAECVERLGELTRRDRDPLVGITASGGILTIRIRATGLALRRGGDEPIDATEAVVRAELKDHVLPRGSNPPTAGPEHLAEHVLRLLRASHHLGRSGQGGGTVGGGTGDGGTGGGGTLAVVESCTGGMLGELITSIAGSSDVFVGGYITYANGLKERLGVSPGTLARVGAVSPETAHEMALAGLSQSRAGYCLAITGIAGPEGGTPAKPVGTVHIALARRGAAAGEAHARRFVFPGDRETVRRRSCVSALSMLYFHLAGRPSGEPRLLWEAPAAP